MIPLIDHAELLRRVEYNPATGRFKWKTSKRKSSIGKLAGRIHTRTGYRRIDIDGRVYACSRLAYFYVVGKWPTHQIDHINRERADDRWINLRPATASENMKNRKSWRWSNEANRAGINANRASVMPIG